MRSLRGTPPRVRPRPPAAGPGSPAPALGSRGAGATQAGTGQRSWAELVGAEQRAPGVERLLKQRVIGVQSLQVLQGLVDAFVLEVVLLAADIGEDGRQ